MWSGREEGGTPFLRAKFSLFTFNYSRIFLFFLSVLASIPICHVKFSNLLLSQPGSSSLRSHPSFFFLFPTFPSPSYSSFQRTFNYPPPFFFLFLFVFPNYLLSSNFVLLLLRLSLLLLVPPLTYTIGLRKHRRKKRQLGRGVWESAAAAAIERSGRYFSLRRDEAKLPRKKIEGVNVV